MVFSFDMSMPMGPHFFLGLSFFMLAGGLYYGSSDKVFLWASGITMGVASMGGGRPSWGMFCPMVKCPTGGLQLL